MTSTSDTSVNKAMTQITLEFDPGALSALRQGPEQFAREVKVAAVVQWYAERRISQSKAAEILGISRSALLAELARRNISAVQTNIDELRQELECLAR
jgi:predicted HTH domain antitoxin